LFDLDNYRKKQKVTFCIIRALVLMYYESSIAGLTKGNIRIARIMKQDRIVLLAYRSGE
jgi:hypothetical protein